MSFNNENTPARSADGQRLILKQHETGWWATAKKWTLRVTCTVSSDI